MPTPPDRVSLLGVYDPSEPGAYAPGMFQAFVAADAVAGGCSRWVSSLRLSGSIPEAHLSSDVGGDTESGLV